MPRAYSPVYPEYVEEIKPSLENVRSLLIALSTRRTSNNSGFRRLQSQILLRSTAQISTLHQFLQDLR